MDVFELDHVPVPPDNTTPVAVYVPVPPTQIEEVPETTPEISAVVAIIVIGTRGDKQGFIDAQKREDVIEIWNDVFMEYEKKDGKVIGKLKQKNVDTGAGLERITAVMQGKRTAYDTDIFREIFGKIEEFTTKDDVKSKRIIADHIRASVFMISDGVKPANNGAGYVLRRLLRRATRFADVLGFKHGSLFWLAGTVIEKFKDIYPELSQNSENIKKEIEKEESKFRETLEKGMKEFEKGTDPFVLFTTYGFPFELTLELAKEKGISIDVEDFNKKMAEHQKLSQTASAGMFKGGLANHNEQTIRLHTAHHLLLAGLFHRLSNSGEVISPKIDSAWISFAIINSPTKKNKK